MNGHNTEPILRKYNPTMVKSSMHEYYLYKYLKQFSKFEKKYKDNKLINLKNQKNEEQSKN